MGSAGIAERLAKVQRISTLSITGAMKFTATDTLDAHANLLPTDILLQRVCHRAALRLSTLPASDEELLPQYLKKKRLPHSVSSMAMARTSAGQVVDEERRGKDPDCYLSHLSPCTKLASAFARQHADGVRVHPPIFTIGTHTRIQ
ncbi:hypothetical protein P692DRAFT_20739651 [Suillus brevipes Sb2]|nr:hypothetical protein P692DRAFT_20739651 [Suillus brevipes Sb2]